MTSAINPGDIINNKYKIIKLIDETGMSFVYKAKDQDNNNNEVAIKFLKPSKTSTYIEDVIRFKREIESVSKLNHPNVLKLYNFGEYKNSSFLVTELLPGQSLYQILKQNKTISIKNTVQIIKQIATALNYVHNKSIIHRDIKPGNIFINKQNNNYKIKLLDFGLSLVMELSAIKETEEIVGTFGYMSPEATGIMKKPIDERSDLYSLGVVFYQLLTGELPFKEKNIRSLLHQQVTQDAIPITRINNDVPEILEEIINKLMNKEQDLRYQSAKGFLYDIDKYLSGERKFIIGQNDQKRKLTYQTRVIGREKELEQINSLITKLWNNEGNICFIGGDPGVGKTKLVETLKANIYNKGYKGGGLYLEGRCVSQDNKSPYQPFKDVINEYIEKVNKLDKNKRNEEISRIKSVVGELGEIINRLNPNMRELLTNMPNLIALEPEKENQRFLMIATAFFLHIAKNDSICILFLDDLQWADESTLKLLGEISKNINKSNLMLVGTYRSNEINDGHSLTKIIKESKKQDKCNFLNIELKKFDHKKLNKLVANILGEEEKYAVKLTDYILTKSGGNAFFAITILRELVEQKTLEWKEGRWIEDWNKINKIRILNNIVDMVLLRIKNLPPALEKLLKLCSVIGKEFELDILFDLINNTREYIIRLVDEAIDRQLLEQSLMKRGKIIFLHDRIKEAFYSKMTRAEKKGYHLKIGSLIEKRNKKNTDNVIFELAHHFTKSKDIEKTIKYLLPAARKAKDNYANEEAIKYYKQYTGLLDKNGRKEITEWINAKKELTDVYLTAGYNDKAIKISKEILPLVNEKIDKAKIYRKIGNAYFKKGDYSECENTMIVGLKLLNENIPVKILPIVTSILLELIIHLLHFFLPFLFKHKKQSSVKKKYLEISKFYNILTWMYVLCDLNKFIRNVFKWLNITEAKIGNSKELGASIGGYASLLMAVPIFKLAIKNHYKGLNIRKESNDEWGQAQSFQWLGYSYSWKGDHKKSLEAFYNAKEKFDKIGDLWELGMTYHGIAHGYRYTSQYDKGIHFDSLHHGIAEKINDTYGMAESNSCVSYCYTETGDFLKAEKLGKNAVNVSRKHNQLFALCFTTEHYGYLQLEKNNFLEAIKYLEESKDLFEKNTFLKDYTTYTYPYLADAYIEKYKINKNTKKIKLKKEELVKIKKACKKALSITMPWPNHYGASLRVSAKYYSLVNKKNKAKRYFNKAIRQTKLIGRRYELAKSHYEYGNFFDQIDKKENAKEQWNKAYNIFKEIGAQEYIKHTKKLLNITDEKEIAKDDISPQERLRLDRRMNTVLDTSRHLSSILDINELLEKIMDKTVELVGAERGILYLNINNKLKPKILRNIKQGESDLITINDIVITQVQKENKPLIFEDASSIKKSLSSDSTRSSTNISLKSILCAPIITKNELLGVLYLDNHRVTGLFKEEDLKVLELISSQAGVSIENARLYNNLKEQERLKKEMEIAKRIQTAIVPEAPLHDELYITAVMQPAEEVGGDYYDIMYDKNKNLWFAIGDVSGHGVTPGLVMMMAQSSFAATISDNGNLTPKEAIVNVNKILYENIKTRLKEDHFMTMDFIKHLGKGNFIHAGSHLDIIIYRDKTKTCELVATKGVYLGLIPDASRSLFDNTFSLNKNDLMLLYTDGVTEARNKDNRNDLWGEDNLQNMLIKHSSNEVEAIKDAIVKKVLDWCGNKPDDDITMVLIRRK